MPGRVFVTGGSGFVGSAVLDELAGRGYIASALSRSGKIDSRGGKVIAVPGDVMDPTTLDDAMRACEAVIHLVGIIRERPSRGVTFNRIHYKGTRHVVDAAKRKWIRRFVHMSALGSRPGAISEYHRSKHKAEEYVRASRFDWTIFRPSLIHGLGGEFMQMEARWARRTAPPFLFMPYFGAGAAGFGGAGRLQPVYVKDVARAFVDALEKPKTIGQVYPLGGPDEITWPQLHAASAQAIVGRTPIDISSPWVALRRLASWINPRNRFILPLPAWYAKALTYVVPRFLLPFNRDQVVMSQEDNTCDLSKFREDFGWEPQPLGATLASYAQEL